MGIWNQARQSIAKLLSKDSAFSKINRSFDNKHLAAIIELRNDIAHGTEPSERQAIEQLNKNEVPLKLFVKKLWQNLNFDIVMPTSLRFDGSLFELDGLLLSGESNTLPKLKIKISTPLICNQAYLRVVSTNSFINLFPFLIAEEANEPLTWKILIFDGIKIDKNKNPAGDEPLRYIETWSGQRNIIPINQCTSRMLPAFLTGLDQA